LLLKLLLFCLLIWNCYKWQAKERQLHFL
jgi:hypothetical protein